MTSYLNLLGLKTYISNSPVLLPIILIQQNLQNFENQRPCKRVYLLHKENTPAAVDSSIDGVPSIPQPPIPASHQQQPPAPPISSSSSSLSSPLSEDHVSSSSIDFELLSSVGSSAVSSNILSPIAELSPKKKNSLRGDLTPHSHKKHILGHCNNSATIVTNSSHSTSTISTSTATTNTSSIQQNVSCCAVTPSSELRLCPLPALAWAEAADVWRFMCRKDEKASLDRDSQMLSNHPGNSVLTNLLPIHN